MPAGLRCPPWLPGGGRAPINDSGDHLVFTPEIWSSETVTTKCEGGVGEAKHVIFVGTTSLPPSLSLSLSLPLSLSASLCLCPSLPHVALDGEQHRFSNPEIVVEHLPNAHRVLALMLQRAGDITVHKDWLVTPDRLGHHPFR